MENEKLKTILEENGENSEILSARLMKFGCLSFSSINSEFTTEYTDSHDEISDAYITDALKSSTNVFDLNILDITPDESIFESAVIAGHFLYVGKIFELKIKIPTRFQKFEYPSSPEEFNVISNGSIFASICPVSKYPMFNYIGQEYRDIAIEQVNTKEGNLYANAVGPSPNHIDFYVVKVKNDFDDYINVYLDEDNVIISYNSDREIDDICVILFHQISFPLFYFYRNCLFRIELLYRYMNVLDQRSELTESIVNVYNASFWQFKNKFILEKNAREIVSKIHNNIFLLEKDIFSFEEMRSSAKTTFLKSRYIEPVIDYFENHSNSDVCLHESLFHSLQYFQSELSRLSSNRIQFLVALFIGIVTSPILFYFLQP